MKRIILALTALTLTTGAAAAYELSNSDKAEARRLAPTANFDNLTPAQAQAIHTALYGDEDNRAGQIRAIALN